MCARRRTRNSVTDSVTMETVNEGDKYIFYVMAVKLVSASLCYEEMFRRVCILERACVVVHSVYCCLFITQ